MKTFTLVRPANASILSTLVLIMGLFSFETHAGLEEAFPQKEAAFERLWEVSMNKLEVAELEGELHADHWDSIRPKTKSVREVAALVVKNLDTNEIKLRNMNMGEKSSGALYFNTNKNEVILGRFHTHPYEYESLKNLPFSPRDLVDLYTFNPKTQLKNDFFTLIKSGEKYFAMVIEDQERAVNYFKAQTELAKNDQKTIFDFLYKKFYSINKGSSIQEIQLNSLLLITDRTSTSGIGLFEITEGNWKKLN